jgi:hypothetical protein
MVDACAFFLEHLDGSQREAASFSFEDDERLRWSYLPGPRRGLALAELGPEDRVRLQDLLSCALSATGTRTASAIIEHEEILGAIEATEGLDTSRRNPGLYWFGVFGEPDGSKTWGWRFEGHHLSLHFTLEGDALVAVTPSFFGANPARVPSGPRRGLRILAPLEDLARALMASFSQTQRSQALVADVPPHDIVTSTQVRIELGGAEGVTFSSMSAEQQGRLEALIGAYFERVAEPYRSDARQAARGAHFMWSGGLGQGQPHYYRIQGRSLLIEYDNVQNGANHIHTVWRDESDDFGFDPLREHHLRHHT